ncbi:hypothetical protein V6N13_073525 [Hibiscus sabdariffa]
MAFGPTSGGCHNIQCTADIIGECPDVLRAPGGCNNPCTVFQTNEYCCTQGPGSLMRRISQGFSRRGALMHTVIHRTILQAPSLALAVSITVLCFAPQARLIWRWSEARAKKSKGMIP